MFLTVERIEVINETYFAHLGSEQFGRGKVYSEQVLDDRNPLPENNWMRRI